MQTPDDYCDGIVGIAFDRLTTAKAYADGIAARDAELAKQDPVAVIFRLRSGEWQLRVDQPPDGTLRNPTQLFAHPIPPPDVRELVEALRPFAEYERCRQAIGGTSPRAGTIWSVSSKAGEAEITVEDMQSAMAALTKHRGQS